METTRRGLTPEHHTVLRDFVRLVYEMDHCRFVRKYRKQQHTVSCWQGLNGEAKFTAPDYDWEDFRAFMTIFRRVAIAVQEPTHLANVYKLIRRYASDALRKEIARERPQVMTMLTGKSAPAQGGRTMDGEEAGVSVSKLLDMATNGMIFQEEPSDREAGQEDPKTFHWRYLWPAIHFRIMPTLRGTFRLFHYLWRDGILADGDYPEAWQTSKGTSRVTCP
jgi:hypothetical protein